MAYQGRCLYGIFPCYRQREKAEMLDPEINHTSGRGGGSISNS
jgi:hypothetical protein